MLPTGPLESSPPLQDPRQSPRPTPKYQHLSSAWVGSGLTAQEATWPFRVLLCGCSSPRHTADRPEDPSSTASLATAFHSLNHYCDPRPNVATVTMAKELPNQFPGTNTRGCRGRSCVNC